MENKHARSCFLIRKDDFQLTGFKPRFKLRDENSPKIDSMKIIFTKHHQKNKNPQNFDFKNTEYFIIFPNFLYAKK